jgi:hypothetical protein
MDSTSHWKKESLELCFSRFRTENNGSIVRYDLEIPTQEKHSIGIQSALLEKRTPSDSSLIHYSHFYDDSSYFSRMVPSANLKVCLNIEGCQVNPKFKGRVQYRLKLGFQDILDGVFVLARSYADTPLDIDLNFDAWCSIKHQLEARLGQVKPLLEINERVFRAYEQFVAESNIDNYEKLIKETKSSDDISPSILNIPNITLDSKYIHFLGGYFNEDLERGQIEIYLNQALSLLAFCEDNEKNATIGLHNFLNFILNNRTSVLVYPPTRKNIDGDPHEVNSERPLTHNEFSVLRPYLDDLLTTFPEDLGSPFRKRDFYLDQLRNGNVILKEH